MESTEVQLTKEQKDVFDKLEVETKKVMKSPKYQSTVTDPDYYTNPQAILRFCRAHEFVYDTIFQKWSAWLDWRISYKPQKINEDEECIERQVETGKLRWFKNDKEKRPCLYYKMRYHKPGLATTEESVRYFLYMLEKGIADAEKLGTEKIVIIFDRHGYSKKNHDPATMDTMKKLMPILQDYYPERLHMFFVLGANWFYRAMFEVVKLFLSKKTLEKVTIIAENSDLLQWFDKDSLSIEYGGVTESSKFGKAANNQSVGSHGGDDWVNTPSEDERELKALADKIYKNHGVKKPVEEYED